VNSVPDRFVAVAAMSTAAAAAAIAAAAAATAAAAAGTVIAVAAAAAAGKSSSFLAATNCCKTADSCYYCSNTAAARRHRLLGDLKTNPDVPSFEIQSMPSCVLFVPNKKPVFPSDSPSDSQFDFTQIGWRCDSLSDMKIKHLHGQMCCIRFSVRFPVRFSAVALL
jgi:hypothetical protein